MNKTEQDGEPCVGIFWLVNGELLFDQAPLSTAERYGDHLGYPRGHSEVWEQFRRLGQVPYDSEYDEFPRGRVIYNNIDTTFVILADHCILARKDLIAKIKSHLHLPGNTTTATDLHYRCPTCLYGEP